MQVMEVIGGNTVGLDRVGRTLGHIESHLDPAYDVMRISRVALGDAPINFASTAVTGSLRMALGSSDAKTNQAIGHAGLAADGLFRGLLYSGGILHGTAARKLPWLVLDRTPPAGFGRVASSLDTLSRGARLGLLGIGGTLGAVRAAKAVVAGGGDARALYMTRDGRGGTLQAVGSALLMVKHPVTYLAGAGVYAAALVNDLL
ncbi:MAG: hypothetical protein JWL76_801 [Thermoleophilia bacterium]|nr:hypothetical protein [Thermoleophilia bacterium]